MGAKEPGPQGERAISVKTIAQGRPECFRLYLLVGAHAQIFSARGPRVQRAPGLPRALCFPEGSRKMHHSGAMAPRECVVTCDGLPGAAFSVAMPRFKRGIQYAVASRLNHCCLWNTGSPGQAGRRP